MYSLLLSNSLNQVTVTVTFLINSTTMNLEPLQLVPIEKWSELQAVCLTDWPRELPGYNALETQSRWQMAGLDYEFRVYSLFGDPNNGFVALNIMGNSYGLVIQYPKEDTNALERALKTTKVIDWDQPRITLAFAACHVISAMQKVIKDKDVVLDLIPSHTFIIEKGAALFEDVSLPPGFTFELLSSEHVELIDLKWPHRYPSSSRYFQILIDSKSGYGLFKNGKLASWIFIGECGHLTHLFTLEEYRKQGLAELILKLISNELLKTNRQVFAFCVKGNENAFKLYKKMSFKESNNVSWGFVCKKIS